MCDLLRAGVGKKEVAEIANVSIRTVERVRLKLDTSDDMSRKPGSGGQNKVLCDEFLEDLVNTISEDPSQSMRKLAKDKNVSEITIRRAVEKLDLHSYVHRERQLLTEVGKARRVERGTLLMNWMKRKPGLVRVFSDEKNWTVDQKRNARNDRFLASCPSEVPPIMKTKHPASVMCLGVVTSDGKTMPLHWFQKGLRMGAKEYVHVLRTVVKPWLDENYPEGNYVWQQDGAPCHTANLAQNYCANHLANFWPKDFWPPSSPDLNPLDYAVWSEVERKACNVPHRNMDELKGSVDREWDALTPEYLVKTCRAFRRRLEAVIEAKGGHIEK